MARVLRSRWSVLVVMVALSALCVTPLACVLNCLLGGCMHAAQAQTRPATAHIARPVCGAVGTAIPATPDTLTAAPTTPRSKHHCCKVRKQERPPQPAAETSATPKTPTSFALAAKTASRPSTLRLETNGRTDGRQDLRETLALAGADDACCGCRHVETPDRFTVAPLFTFEALLVPRTYLPVRLPVARRSTAPQPPVVVAYLPSHRETYIRCCVFRI